MPANASAELAGIAARLRAVGDKGLTNQFRAGLRAAAKPLVTKVKAAALEQLPKTGGLNKQVAGQRVSVSIPLTPRTASVRLRTTAPDTAQTDSGFVRHPVYGNRNVWIKQDIPQAVGWWSQTLRDAGPEVTAALIVVMKAVEIELSGRL